MGIDVWFSNKTIDWYLDKILLNSNWSIGEPNIYDMLYSMHTDSPIIKEVKERTAKILDSDYSTVYIDSMVDNLDINKYTKIKLKENLKAFPTIFD